MKIDDKSKELLKDVLKEASEGKKERIGLLIDKADVDEDVKENFQALLDEAAPEKEKVSKDILDALKVDGIKYNNAKAIQNIKGNTKSNK